MDYELEWDPAKSAANFKVRKIDFETAGLVFQDPLARRTNGYERNGEMRFETFGEVGPVILRVTHTSEWLEDRELIRIISARRADKSERERYEEANCFP